MPSYNGHQSHAAWNVSMWIANDEGLYRMAKDWIRRCSTLDDAAKQILHNLHECDIYETPDGVRYTKTNVRRAIAGGF